MVDIAGADWMKRRKKKWLRAYFYARKQVYCVVYMYIRNENRNGIKSETGKYPFFFFFAVIANAFFDVVVLQLYTRSPNNSPVILLRFIHYIKKKKTHSESDANLYNAYRENYGRDR